MKNKEKRRYEQNIKYNKNLKKNQQYGTKYIQAPISNKDARERMRSKNITKFCVCTFL